jgi:non-lysosomal glucosylceramidase
MDDPNAKIPPFQLGKGCLVDQLAGQYLGHVCGLGYLGDPQHMRKTLQTIYKYNRIERFDGLFNNMRSFVMGNETGLVMASWPKGRLKVPFPYFAESMTGFEYTAAIGMLYEGQTAMGLQVIRDIRSRFDGEKRNPFDEPECGHHYARAMASWSAIPALTGFHYSGISMVMEFNAQPGSWFWSNGYAWGTIKIVKSATGVNATLKVLYGRLNLVELKLTGMKPSKDNDSVILKDGAERVYRFVRGV